MPSYNEIDGVPSHANRWLLEDVLRGEWGFRGTVVSDYFAITRAERDGRTRSAIIVAADRKDAARLAVRAGVNIELPDPDCYPHLLELVREGTIPESLIDERVRPMLRAKFQTAAVRGSVRRSRRGRTPRARARRTGRWRSKRRERRSRC